jgi:UDP-glucose 4-epimerase
MGKAVTVLDIVAPQNGNIDGCRVVKGDIRDADLVRRLIQGIDAVYHLAAVTTFHECRDYPNKALHANAYGASTVIQEAAKCDVSSFVLFSSASVYSGSKKPVKCEGMPLAPKSIYGITKLMGEILCSDIGTKNGLPCTILRPFNVYGERGRGVINKFADATKGDKRITIYGDGSQVRDYIHVDDVVRMAVAAGEGRMSGVYNVGTGGRCSLLTLKETVESVSGVTLTVERQPREPWDMQELVADTKKAKEILPTTIPLVEGITALLEGEERKGHRDTRKSSR